MLTRSKRSWELPERLATPEHVYLNRRRLLGGMAVGSLVAATSACLPEAVAEDQSSTFLSELYPVDRNPSYTLDRAITAEDLATSYNNFYEFGSHKRIARAAQALELRPWTVKFTGLVEQPRELDAEELLRQMPLEERLYRHRCVEAWAMAVPWSGFPLRSLIEFARPLGSAKYLRMVTFEKPDVAPGQRQFWYPWPYVEGLTMDEATNELAFIATGLYGKPIPKQNGAPLRLAVPWKYGFKSVKSITVFDFVEERPVSFWEAIQAAEYGFWANVNPEVPHPRWSQATEEVLGTKERVPTQLFNGYGEQVAALYKGREGETLYR